MDDSVIHDPSTSTISGFPSASFDMGKALSILHWCQAHGVTYGLGCKVKDLAASPPTFVDENGHSVNAVDCSGLHRYLWKHCAGLTIPDGSSAQNDWCQKQGFKHYGHDEYGLCAGQDNVLRACFCRAGSRGESIGHVWFCWNGHSIESHGGGGPDSRPWNTLVLSRIVTDVYVIGRFPPI